MVVDIDVQCAWLQSVYNLKYFLFVHDFCIICYFL